MALLEFYVDTDATPGVGDGSQSNPYASLNEWDMAEETNLTSDGDNVIVYCSGSAEDTAELSLSGWGTGPSNDIVIIGNWGGGTWDVSKYRMCASAGYNMYILEEYVSVKCVQFDMTRDSYSIRSGLSSTGVFNFERCIFRGNTSSTAYYLLHLYNNSGVSCTANIWNCILYGYGAGGFGGGMYIRETDAVVYNCTIADLDSYGIRTSVNGTMLLKNVLIYNVYDSLLGTPATGSDYCALDEGTGPGSNSIDISGESGSNIFNDYSNKDFTLKDGSATTVDVVDAGTDLSGDGVLSFSDDITGTTRTGTWDIGAFEYAVTGNSHNASFMLSAGGSTGVQVTVPAFVQMAIEGAGNMLVISPASFEFDIEGGSVRGDVRSSGTTIAASGSGMARLTSPVSHSIGSNYLAFRRDIRPISQSVRITGDGTIRLTIPVTYNVQTAGNSGLHATIPAAFEVEIDLAAVISGSEGMVHAATFVLGTSGGVIRADVRPGLNDLSINSTGVMRRIFPADVSIGVSHDAVKQVVAEAAALLGIEFGVTVNQPIVVGEILSLVSEISRVLGIASTFTVRIVDTSRITTLIQEDSLI